MKPIQATGESERQRTERTIAIFVLRGFAVAALLYSLFGPLFDISDTIRAADTLVVAIWLHAESIRRD